MIEKIFIFDFGLQYMQFIVWCIWEFNVYSEIVFFNKVLELDDIIKGIILLGSFFFVVDENVLYIDLD